MTKEEFRKFCREEFYKRGFVKAKKGYYLNGDKGVVGAIFLQKSSYGADYYLNYKFYITEGEHPSIYPSEDDADIEGRVRVMSKSATKNGKCFMIYPIPYEEYTRDEFKVYLDKAFEEEIMPPIILGKEYIVGKLGEVYHLGILHGDEVMEKLKK